MGHVILHEMVLCRFTWMIMSFTKNGIFLRMLYGCLPKGTITKLVKNIKGIKKVEQPFDGFVGVSTETKDEFYCRVSEKLHHKGKAWSCWDYERILLEKYPQLAAVKCTPCSSNPGTVKIVVFPNVSLVPQDNIFRPQIDAFTQDEIERFLPTISSPFVKFSFIMFGW